MSDTAAHRSATDGLGSIVISGEFNSRSWEISSHKGKFNFHGELTSTINAGSKTHRCFCRPFVLLSRHASIAPVYAFLTPSPRNGRFVVTFSSLDGVLTAIHWP